MKFTRSHLFALVLAVAAGAVTYAVLLKPSPEPAELVRRKAIQMARAAERRDLGFIMDQVSPRFRSEEGWSRDELRAFLAGQILRGEWIRVFTADLETWTESPTSVRFAGKFILGRSEAKQLKDLARESVLGSYRIQAKAEKEPDGEWRFVWASHEPVDPMEPL